MVSSVSAVASSSSDVSSSSLSEDLKLEGAEILAITKSRSIVGFAPSGSVTDESGVPLPGVNVVIKGTETGTSTDFDGNYSISVSESDLLIF